MSWDVVLVKERFELENNNDYSPPYLGKRDEIIDALLKIFPNLDYTDESWGILNEADFSIEFNTGNDEIVDSIMLHIRGGGNPLNVIKLIIKEMNWEALDCSTTKFIEIDEDNLESWTEFQKYRDSVLKRNKD